MAGIPLALNFDLGAPLPLDSRIVIAQFSQLNNINPKYSGMQVYASDTKKLYYLEDLPTNKWTEVITNSNLPSLPTSLVYTTGNQTIGGTKTFSNIIGGSIDGNAATVTNGVYTIGNQTIGGEKTFSTRPKVGISGVLLQGEIPSLPNTIVYTTGNQLISGSKTFLDDSVFNKNIDAFEKISLTNRNWSLTNTFFGTVLTGSGSSGQFIGEQLYLNNDGNILITYGSNNYNDNWSRGTYIFTTGVNNTWRLLQEIVTTVSGYGRAFKMSRDNSVLVIGNPNDFLTSNGIVYRPGEVHVYTGSIQNGWIKKQTLTGIIENYEEFGSSIAISDNAEVIAVGSPRSEFAGNGRINIFTGSKNTEWRLKQIITGDIPIGGLGASLACNHDASLILAGSLDRTISGGFACTFVGSPTTNWALQQRFSGVFENGDYFFAGYPRFGVGVDINNSGNILMITDPNKIDGRGCVYFYTGSKNNTWVNTSQVFGLYPRSLIRQVKCNNDASVVLVGASDYPNYQGDDGYALILQKSTDFSWFIKQQIPEPSGGYKRLGEGISINGKGDTFALGTRLTSSFASNLFEKGAINVYKDLTPNEFTLGNVFPESFLKIIGSTKFVGDTIISGNTKLYSNDRPSINDKLIVVSGEAIIPDSDARLSKLEFKNFSEFALEGPYFRSSYKGSGVPASTTMWGSEGRIIDFTDTGVTFFSRPRVNGSGILLQGEASESTPNLTNVVFTTGDQTITGNKNFISRPTVNNTGIVLQGETLDEFFGNRPIRRLPVADTNYGGVTISGFLTNLFFPYLNTTIGLNPFSIYTYGIDSLSSINFNSTITSNDDTVTGLAAFRGLLRVGGIDPISVNGIQTISQTATLSPNVIATTTSSCLSRVYITRSGVSTNIASSNIAIRFEPRYYFGLSANTSLTSAQITGLQNIIGPNTHSNFYNYAINVRPTNLVATFNNPVNQYLYLVYPGQEVSADSIKDWGSITSIVDTVTFQQYTNEFEALPNVTVNLGTKTLIYRVHRSKLTWNINASFNLQFNL